MKSSVALRVLSEIMDWDDDTARREFAWLSLLSRMKYDGYRDFVAGVRFVESLADWLQQFAKAERLVAYQFVRQHLIYFGPAEIQHLVELVYPETIRKQLTHAAAQRAGVPSYMVWAHDEGNAWYRKLLRRTLFLGLSDGARTDVFRRANVGVISNEQVVIGTQLDEQKWDSLLKDLRKEQSDPQAKFEFAYLIDDFVGSGKTLLREESGVWTGKLLKFWNHIKDVRESHFSNELAICVHHYIGSYAASVNVAKQRDDAAAALGSNWFPKDAIHFSFGTILPEDLPIDDLRCADFMKIVHKYYDSSLANQHTDVGGSSDVRLGFGGGALPVILEHNTPNNSVALLWADTNGDNGQHAMRPLFRRRQRHA